MGVGHGLKPRMQTCDPLDRDAAGVAADANPGERLVLLRHHRV